MSIKKLMFIFLGFCQLSLISGCASSSFNEYFNEPVTVVEKSVLPVNTYNTNSEITTSKKEESEVQTFPVEDLR